MSTVKVSTLWPPVHTKALLDFGIRCTDAAQVSVTERSYGDIVLLSLNSRHRNQLFLSSPSAASEYTVFAFVSATSVRVRFEDDPWQDVVNGLVLVPFGARASLRLGNYWSVTAVLVPRIIVTSFGALPRDIAIATDSHLLETAMERFTRSLFEAATRGSLQERRSIETLVSEMGRSVVLNRIGATAEHRTGPAILFTRAIAIIREQCTSPDLDPHQVAEKLNVSLRTLQHAFAHHDKTVAEEIRRHRTRLAKALLLDSQFSTVTAAQIAYYAGFRSPMSLRRALAEFADTTPRALRNRLTSSKRSRT